MGEGEIDIDGGRRRHSAASDMNSQLRALEDARDKGQPDYEGVRPYLAIIKDAWLMVLCMFMCFFATFLCFPALSLMDGWYTLKYNDNRIYY